MGAADELRSRVEEAWTAFRSAIERVDDLDAATQAGWSAKEMVAHVAFWLETVPPFVTGAYRGDESAFQVTFPSGYEPGDEDWPPADVHNAREAAWAREQTAGAVVERADNAYASLEDFLRTVSDEEVDRHAAYFGAIHGHLDEHRAELTS